MTGDGAPDALVAAVGNPDRGDDGFATAVTDRLRGRVSAETRVLQCGGSDVLALIDDWTGVATVILVDAAAPLGRPGRIHRFDLTARPLPAGFSRSSSTHAIGLAEAVELARSLGRLPRHLIAYVVEGERFDAGAPLSPAVAAAVVPTAERILSELSTRSAPLPPPMKGVAGNA